MTPKKSPLPRWPLAIAAMVVVPGLAVLLTMLVKDRVAPSAPGAPSASATAGPRGAAALPLADRPRAGVSGRVLDAAGAPVPAATVCAFVSPTVGTTTQQIATPRCAVGDANGAYTLADLPSRTTFSLSAGAPSFPPQIHGGESGDGTLRLAEGELRAGVDFRLRGGGVLVRGRVADATGGVVPGAAVVSEAGEATGRAVVTTDAKGEFSIWVGPGTVMLGATASGYAPGRARGPAPGHFFSIYLVPGATLVGRAVIAGTDTAVPSAKIEAIQVEGGGTRASAPTDSDGRFRVEGLTPGRYRIEATAEGREGYSRSSITLGMGETSPETIVELDPAYVVKGSVVVKGGEACKKGLVTITDGKQNEFSQGTIEPDGTVRMPSVIPGKYKVEVDCEGHFARDDYPEILVQDRDVPPQTWEVEAGASVRVAVVDPTGKAVPEATVSAFSSGERDSSGASIDHPEPDGTFLVRGLKAGTFRVSVRTPDGAHGEQEDVIVDGRREERVKIELPLSGAIEGVVEDLDHRPVANVTVMAAGPRRQAVRTLDDGTFVLAGLPTGDYTLSPQDPTRGRTTEGDEPKREPVKVSLTAPGRARATLTLDKRLGSISGRVVDADGQPIIDAFIEYGRAQGPGVPRRGGGGAPVVTDTEGRFTIEGLLEGEYGLRAYRKGGGEGTAEHVKVGTRGVTLRIGLGAAIAGTLSSPKGPVERFQLRVRDKKTGFMRDEMFFHAKGTFALRDLPPGTYDVVAETPEGTATAEVTVAEGEQKAGVSLTMAMRGTVDGRIVAADGSGPVAGLRVSVVGDGNVSPMNDYDAPGAVTDRDGRFHLEDVLGGKWTLSFGPVDPEATAFEMSTQSVELSTSGATDLGVLKAEKRAPQPENVGIN
jgi:protocatechuate 3,4-dioxygenase beta subunit